MGGSASGEVFLTPRIRGPALEVAATSSARVSQFSPLGGARAIVIHMKRDMELYRQILSEVESWSTTLAPKQVQIEGYAQDQIGYHAWMLAEEDC